MSDPQHAIFVNSVPEEYQWLASQACDCGGRFNRDMQALMEIDGRYYDKLECTCANCGKKAKFWFDINSFFGKW